MERLIDGHARKIDYLRLSVTDRCNLRCVYCMPEGGVAPLEHADILSYEEIERFAACACRSGITKIRLTGGEPLVRKDIEVLVAGLAALAPELDLSLTTNGIFLDKHAQPLREAGLARVNISIDSLDAEVYRRITRGGELEPAIRGIEAALEAGLTPVKLNVVTLAGVNDDLEPFVRFMRRYPVDLRFIEYMDTRGAGSEYFISAADLESRLASHGELKDTPAPVGAGPARYRQLEGALGKVGFISPVSSHFCPSCNRLRLTADGKLRACLFSDSETDVRELLRSGAGDSEISRVIAEVLAAKPRDHAGAVGGLKRTMSQIGG
ncbi:MAG: GTP 3',8-cyclase MoaA [Candidatus Geothermincolia bacterium]